MATTNEKFREDLDNLSVQSNQKGSILDKLWNALLDFLGLNSMSQVNKDYVTSEIFQYIEAINQSKSGFKGKGWAVEFENGYEVSTVGDKRFSALVAKLKDGRTIEEAYQLDVKGFRQLGND
jgi:hypothetical protein